MPRRTIEEILREGAEIDERRQRERREFTASNAPDYLRQMAARPDSMVGQCCWCETPLWPVAGSCPACVRARKTAEVLASAMGPPLIGLSHAEQVMGVHPRCPVHGDSVANSPCIACDGGVF